MFGEQAKSLHEGVRSIRCYGGSEVLPNGRMHVKVHSLSRRPGVGTSSSLAVG